MTRIDYAARIGEILDGFDPRLLAQIPMTFGMFDGTPTAVYVALSGTTDETLPATLNVVVRDWLTVGLQPAALWTMWPIEGAREVAVLIVAAGVDGALWRGLLYRSNGTREIDEISKTNPVRDEGVYRLLCTMASQLAVALDPASEIGVSVPSVERAGKSNV